MSSANDFPANLDHRVLIIPDISQSPPNYPHVPPPLWVDVLSRDVASRSRILLFQHKLGSSGDFTWPGLSSCASDLLDELSQLRDNETVSFAPHCRRDVLTTCAAIQPSHPIYLFWSRRDHCQRSTISVPSFSKDKFLAS
jgi:hypothetical protein